MANEIRKVWLKAETYCGERRCLLTPADAHKLVENGIPVYVEKSDIRVFPNSEYEAAGCKLVEPDTWNSPEANNSIVLAVKYLDKVDRLSPAFPIKDRILIHWAHSYDFDPIEQLEIARLEDTSITVPALHQQKYIPKKDLLTQDDYHHQLDGLHALHSTNLLDLEVMQNPDGSRLVDGYNAGLSGAACSLFTWLNKYHHASLDDIPRPFDSVDALATVLRTRFSEVPQKDWPRCGVIGKGRAGQGAVALLDQVGIQHDTFSREQTKDAQAFGNTITSYDIALNCTCLHNNTIPLITDETLLHNQKLSVIGDISSYPTLGILRFHKYKHEHNWDQPTLRVQDGAMPVDIVSIDNLPSLIAKPVSTMLSGKLTDKIMALAQHREGSSLGEFFGIPAAIAQQHLDLAASVKDLAFAVSSNCFADNRFDNARAIRMIKQWSKQNPLSPQEQNLFKGYFSTGFMQVYELRDQVKDAPPQEAGQFHTQLAVLDDFTERLNINEFYKTSQKRNYLGE